MKENYDELINQSHYRSGLWDAYWNVAKLFAIISLPINCDGTCKECEACNHHRIELESLRQAYQWEIELNHNLANPQRSEFGIPISPYPVED